MVSGLPPDRPRRGACRGEPLEGRRMPTRGTAMVRPAWKNPLALFGVCRPKVLGDWCSGGIVARHPKIFANFSAPSQGIVNPRWGVLPSLRRDSQGWHCCGVARATAARNGGQVVVVAILSRWCRARTFRRWALRAWAFGPRRQNQGPFASRQRTGAEAGRQSAASGGAFGQREGKNLTQAPSNADQSWKESAWLPRSGTIVP
jgi:hypothetical protein